MMNLRLCLSVCLCRRAVKNKNGMMRSPPSKTHIPQMHSPPFNHPHCNSSPYARWLLCNNILSGFTSPFPPKKKLNFLQSPLKPLLYNVN